MNDSRRRQFLTQTGGLLVAAALSRGASSASKHRVTIEKMAFDPPVLEVARGDRVEWHNADLVPHTVTNASKKFDSGSIAPGATWAHTPAVAGEYSYVCSFHPTMRGVLRVR